MLKLSLVTFGILFYLFSFNGYIVSHYAVGHFSWAGYFLFPLFIGLMIQFDRGKQGWKWVAAVAVLLFFMVLAGSEHHFLWLMIFMSVLALSHWKRAGWILAAMLFGSLLSAVRLLPPVIELGSFQWVAELIPTGYPSIADIVRAMALPVRVFDPSLIVSSPLGYWEFNLYLGFLGTLYLVYFGLVYWVKKLNQPNNYSHFFVPVIAMIFFSLSDAYLLLKQIPIPIFDGERVSARIIAVPLVLLIIMASIYFQQWLSSTKKGKYQYISLLLFFALGFYDLRVSLRGWYLKNVLDESGADIAARVIDPNINLVINHPDPVYFTVLGIGLLISVVTAIILVYLVIREKRLTRMVA
jgi:hypothetical protein